MRDMAVRRNVNTADWPSEDARRELRLQVAEHIEKNPELLDQATWGEGLQECGTPCCVAGWACRLSGGTRGLSVSVAALHLLGVPGMPAVNFSSFTSQEELLAQLRGTSGPESNLRCSYSADCVDCLKCRTCYGCSMCARSFECTDCFDCDDCENCAYCSLCSCCFDCLDCFDCENCENCRDCSGVIGGKNLVGVHYPAKALQEGLQALCGG